MRFFIIIAFFNVMASIFPDAKVPEDIAVGMVIFMLLGIVLALIQDIKEIMR